MDYIETQPVTTKRAALSKMYPQWSFHRKYFPASLSAVAGRQRFAHNPPANTCTVSGV